MLSKPISYTGLSYCSVSQAAQASVLPRQRFTDACSDHAHDRMDCRHISSHDVLDSLRAGVVNKSKSDFEYAPLEAQPLPSVYTACVLISAVVMLQVFALSQDRGRCFSWRASKACSGACPCCMSTS